MLKIYLEHWYKYKHKVKQCRYNVKLFIQFSFVNGLYTFCFCVLKRNSEQIQKWHLGIVSSEQPVVLHLQQVGKHDECLLPDGSVVVSQTGWDVGDIMIYCIGVSNTQVTHDHHHIVAHSNLCANLQLPSKHRQVLLNKLLMLETQLTWRTVT